jgi:hypothetical protein
MSYILHDPDEYESVSHYEVCAFHKLHPGEQFAGCCCSAGWSQCRRSDEQIAAIKAERRRKEEDSILAQAELIKAQRLTSPKPEKPTRN